MADFDFSLALRAEPGVPGEAVAAEKEGGGQSERDEGEEDLEHDEGHELDGLGDGLQTAD